MVGARESFSDPAPSPALGLNVVPGRVLCSKQTASPLAARQNQRYAGRGGIGFVRQAGGGIDEPMEFA